MDETTLTCARHPGVETGLRCASCGTPICPSCLVQTPVGMKCKTCASHASGALFSPSLLQGSLAAAVALAAGAIAGWGVEFPFGLFTLFVAFAYGGFAGEMVLRAAGRKRGIKIEAITGTALIIGALGARMLVAGIILHSHGGAKIPFGIWNVVVEFVTSPIPLAALVIIVASAVSRIKYI